MQGFSDRYPWDVHFDCLKFHSFELLYLTHLLHLSRHVTMIFTVPNFMIQGKK